MSSPRAPRILLIRHAEKPPTNPPPHGVTKHGDHDIQSLTVKGWQRAGALVCFFAPTNGPLQSPLLATPVVLFAAPPGSSGSEESQSHRPVETVTPLAGKLGLSINTDFTKGQEVQVADAAMAQSGVALICWQHKDLNVIANRILGNATTAPQKWPGDRYDVVWVFDLQADGSYTFAQLPQMLLKGDDPDPIPAD
ncbi:MAG TPA: hypothetical protein VGO40_24575 [Longimicrobium sp.]|nr:hypothetical protein [Longimicrobium sp.]